ncbi:DNA repair protein RadA [Candidatus Haliotispira prima]|uniref:DNA repair protein RadA n=1 Tax=Candidatus Haliotispira prima TaxID=3034016 RepID=A0ABY8MJE6_9SPIO|nr:DNA repair protein RadA [Candidatus Haliotispira prima]
MAKLKKHFICSVCNQQEVQWQGRCRSCGSWNSFSEEPSGGIPGVSAPVQGRAGTGIKGEQKGHSKAVALAEVPIPQIQRQSSGFVELDRVLGGGLVPGSVVMLGGEPGIGKSTLLLQMAARLQQRGTKVLYVSAEESALQLKIRAERLGCAESQFLLLCNNHLGNLVAGIHRRAETGSTGPELLIVDSLQTILEPSLGTVPGTPSQLRHVTQILQDCCREYKLTMLLVAHLTKDGVIAGPRTVEHMVDCVIYFEHGEHDLRILQANKNRFGSTSEMGILQMTDAGLEELKNPQQYFLSQRSGELPAGIAIAPVHEGSRSLLVEVQALTVPAKGSVSRIFADRLDNARVSRIAAVLERHTGVIFSDQDIYINVAGGLRLQDIALDLPLALALLSARKTRPLPKYLTSAAELSLAGELRPIKHEELRLRSAADFGMQQILLPQKRSTNTGNEEEAKVRITRLDQIEEVLQQIFPSST